MYAAKVLDAGTLKMFHLQYCTGMCWHRVSFLTVTIRSITALFNHCNVKLSLCEEDD